MIYFAVIFDIGGVLTYNPRENIYFGDNGLSNTLKVEPSFLWNIGEKLWKQFAYIKSAEIPELQEIEYRDQPSKAIGKKLPLELWDNLTGKYLRALPGITRLLKDL